MMAALVVILGNFSQQLITDHLWWVAAERSYFGCMSIFSYWTYLRYVVGVKI